ncbi:MAG: DUF362 domain-containing protein [Dehalococcoidales bacterium]
MTSNQESHATGDSRSRVVIKSVAGDVRQAVEEIMTTLAPKTFAGASVLIKPNMVGPSAPALGHTTKPALVTAVARACLDRGARVMVGDNPGGLRHSSRTVAAATGILDASEGCFTSISERVVQQSGETTGMTLTVSRVVLEADYVINLPVFKTHLGTGITGAIKNTFGYVAGACKASLHLEARTPERFAEAVCDVFQVRPPELQIIDAITAIEGNGPCHGGQLRKVGKLIAGTDAVAVDAVMARMMGVDPEVLPVQRLARDLGLGNLDEADIRIDGELVPIPDFKMPVTFAGADRDEVRSQLKGLYPGQMMQTRTTIKPEHHPEVCSNCGDCEVNCPADAIRLEPEFVISNACISCFCCVELCPEGTLNVPDVEAFRHY